MVNFEAASFVLSILGMLGNFFAGFIIVKKRLYLEVRFIILQNLIIEDTLFLLVAIVHSSMNFAGVQSQNITEIILDISKAFLCLSMFLSCFLVIDRMFAIFYCLRYHAVVTQFKVRFAITIAWIISVLYLVTSLSLHGKDQKTTFQGVVMFVIIVPTWIFILVSNIFIEKIRMHHINRINATRKQVMFNTITSPNGEVEDNHKGKMEFFQTTAGIARQIKIINWITLILMTPTAIKAATEVFGVDIIHSQVIASFTLIYIVANAFVYILAMRELKQYTFNLICRRNSETKREVYSLATRNIIT